MSVTALSAQVKTARGSCPFQWALLTVVLGLSFAVGSAEGRGHTYGQGPGLGDNQGTRAPNGTLFLTRSGADGSAASAPTPDRPSFIIDSSLPGMEWWATEDLPTGAFNSVQGKNVTGKLFAMQARDPVSAGGSFYFGFSWENQVQEPKNFHGIFGNGSSFKHDTLINPTNLRLPEGTVIYMGMSRFGAPLNTADMLGSIKGVNRTGAFTAAGAPPTGTFDGNASAFGWVSTTKNAATGEISWNYDPGAAGAQYEYTELVYVVVLPAGWSYVPGDNDEDRFTFVWTVDWKAFDDDTLVDNPNFGNILVPEPGRVVLVGFGMFWLLWRRRR